MKKMTFSLALLASMLTFTSCSTSNGSVSQGIGSAILNNAINNATNNTTTGINALGNILGNILGSSATLSEKSLVGTWKYTGSDCVFESENLLAKAGVAVAAQ